MIQSMHTTTDLSNDFRRKIMQTKTKKIQKKINKNKFKVAPVRLLPALTSCEDSRSIRLIHDKVTDEKRHYTLYENIRNVKNIHEEQIKIIHKK